MTTRVGLIYGWVNDNNGGGGLMTTRVGVIYWWANDNNGRSLLWVG